MKFKATRSAVRSERVLPEIRIKGVPAPTAEPSRVANSITRFGPHSRNAASANLNPATVIGSRAFIQASDLDSGGIQARVVTSPAMPRSSVKAARTAVRISVGVSVSMVPAWSLIATTPSPRRKWNGAQPVAQLIPYSRPTRRYRPLNPASR